MSKEKRTVFVMPVCDVCRKAVKRGSGFLLDSPQVVASEKYIDFYFEHHKDDPFVKTITRDWVRRTMGAMRTPWLVCSSCISMFECDTELAYERAIKWWGKQPIRQESWKLWKERQQIPDEIQEKKLGDLLQRLPIVDESAVLRKWEKVDPMKVLDGITDIGDCSGKWSRPISHLVKVHGTAGVIRLAHIKTAGNNGSFSELVEYARLQKVRGITAIVALYRWSQGESIDDLSVEIFGVPGWGTDTFLVCRIDENIFLCYDAEGTATERPTISIKGEAEKRPLEEV